MSISRRLLIAFLVLSPLFAFALAFFAAYVSQNIAVPDFVYVRLYFKTVSARENLSEEDIIQDNQLFFPGNVSVEAYVYSDGEHQQISQDELSQLKIIQDKEHPSGITFEGASSQSSLGVPFIVGYSYSEGVIVSQDWKERFIEFEVSNGADRPYRLGDREYIYWLKESYD